MSARPDTWMPLYVGDYLGDTMHLTTVQHGAYLLLIMAYWRRGQPLPDDDAQLAAIVRATPAEWRKHRGVLAAFFDIAEGIWRHHRIDAELANAVGNTQSRSDAGRNAARVRWERERNANGMRGASLTHAPSPSPSPSPEEENTHPPAKRRTGLNAQDLAEFESWYVNYPRKEDRGHAEKAWPTARKLAPLEDLIAGVKRYAKAVESTERRYIALPATWLHGKRWEDDTPASANGLAVSQRRAPTGPPPPLQPGWDRDL